MTESPVESEELWLSLSANPETAKTALYQIVNMAAVDNVFQFSELTMMDRFREKLNVSMTDYQKIISDVENLIGKNANLD